MERKYIIVVIYAMDGYVDIVHLTDEENQKYNEIVSNEDYDPAAEDEYDFAQDVLVNRGVYFGDFTRPFFFITTELCVFDEAHKEEPLCVIK